MLGEKGGEKPWKSKSASAPQRRVEELLDSEQGGEGGKGARNKTAAGGKAPVATGVADVKDLRMLREESAVPGEAGGAPCERRARPGGGVGLRTSEQRRPKVQGQEEVEEALLLEGEGWEELGEGLGLAFAVVLTKMVEAASLEALTVGSSPEAMSARRRQLVQSLVGSFRRVCATYASVHTVGIAATKGGGGSSSRGCRLPLYAPRATATTNEKHDDNDRGNDNYKINSVDSHNNNNNSNNSNYQMGAEKMSDRELSKAMVSGNGAGDAHALAHARRGEEEEDGPVASPSDVLLLPAELLQAPRGDLPECQDAGAKASSPCRPHGHTHRSGSGSGHGGNTARSCQGAVATDNDSCRGLAHEGQEVAGDHREDGVGEEEEQQQLKDVQEAVARAAEAISGGRGPAGAALDGRPRRSAAEVDCWEQRRGDSDGLAGECASGSGSIASEAGGPSARASWGWTGGASWRNRAGMQEEEEEQEEGREEPGEAQSFVTEARVMTRLEQTGAGLSKTRTEGAGGEQTGVGRQKSGHFLDSDTSSSQRSALPSGQDRAPEQTSSHPRAHGAEPPAAASSAGLDAGTMVPLMAATMVTAGLSGTPALGLGVNAHPHTRVLVEQLSRLVHACEEGNLLRVETNMLRRAGLVQGSREQQLREEHLGAARAQLRVGAQHNELLQESNELVHTRVELKARQERDRWRAEALAALGRACADELVAGLCVMLFTLLFTGWHFAYERLSQEVAACRPVMPSPPRSWLLASVNYIPDSLASILRGAQCMLIVSGNLVLSLSILGLLTALLLRQNTAASAHQQPATALLLVLSVVCGYFGRAAVEKLGGSGMHWLICWQLICAVHAFATCFPGALFRALHGRGAGEEPRPYAGVLLVPPFVRQTLFHFTTILGLPVVAGAIPFVTLAELQRQVQGGVDGVLAHISILLTPDRGR
eukprot:jgi/Mesen1/2959/ME000176S02004